MPSYSSDIRWKKTSISPSIQISNELTTSKQKRFFFERFYFGPPEKKTSFKDFPWVFEWKRYMNECRLLIPNAVGWASEWLGDWGTGELMERTTSVIIQNIVYHFNCSYEVCKIYYMYVYIRYTYLSLWVDLVVDVSSTTEILLSTLWTSSMDNGCCCSQKKGSLNYCDAVFSSPGFISPRNI